MTTRREVLVTGIGTALAAATAAPAPAQPARKTFVLVHGAWGGGWVWRRVADLLEARGHKVYTPTLTGLGERSHLLDAKVNLSTHITDTVNVIKWERLDNIVLVGHSYAGMVITGVAGQAEHTIGSIVYLDAFLPDDGQSLTELVPQPQIRGAAEKGELTTPPPSAASFAVNEKDRAWVDALSTPHPVATMTEKVTGAAARDRIARKAYVQATGRRAPPFTAARAKIQSNPAWRIYEAPSGHFVMIDMPERLAEILQEV